MGGTVFLLLTQPQTSGKAEMKLPEVALGAGLLFISFLWRLVNAGPGTHWGCTADITPWVRLTSGAGSQDPQGERARG